MKTVPLQGGRAAGRVAFVDDEDYDLVMQYKWRVYEMDKGPEIRPVGPYATTTYWDKAAKRYRDVRMHKLITGYARTDHIDHDGLNNRRSNLRLATHAQNMHNMRPHLGATSQYKGVFLIKKRGVWRAVIKMNDRTRGLGEYVSEIQAAYAYDAAARELFGEFACLNFPEPPTQAMRDEWAAAAEARRAAFAAEHSQAQSIVSAAMWEDRPYRTLACMECGSEYQTRSLRESFYCSSACQQRARRRRISQEKGYFDSKPCAFCGEVYDPRGGPSIYCSPCCNEGARCRRRLEERRARREGRLF